MPRDKTATLIHQFQQRGSERPLVRALGAFVGEQLECPDEPRLSQPLARLQQLAVRRVDRRALVHRHHRLEHRQAGRVRRRDVDAVAREQQSRLDEPRPRQPPVLGVQRTEARWQSRYAAGCDPDRIVDELGAERDLELDQLGPASRLGAEPRHGDEAVEVPRPAAGRLVVHRVAAAEQARHHRLGHAAGEARGDRGVRRRPAGLQHLDPGLDRRRMPRCHHRLHCGRIVTLSARSRHHRCAAARYARSGEEVGGLRDLGVERKNSLVATLPGQDRLSAARVCFLAAGLESGVASKEDELDPHQGSKTGNRRQARQQRPGHRLRGRADRAPHRPHQRVDRAPAHAPERPLLAPRPAQARRSPAPERAARPEAASSVAPVPDRYERSLRPCLGTTIAPQRRALSRQALLALLAVLALAGCGGSSAPQPHGGPTLRLALPLVPTVLDPAKASDLPSLNVSHELYAGLTRFSGTGVEPDLAESWDVEQGGLVWTFHLRKGIRWSDDAPIRAADFRRSWRRALAPETAASYAGPVLGIVRGARRFHATGAGEVGVEALDDRTLRVTLEHPVPWFDELAAFPIAAVVRPQATVFSGPFRLASRGRARRVLERNFNYWNVTAVKPSRLVLGDSTKDADAALPSGLAGPGLPWIDTVGRAPNSSRELPTLATGLLWLVTRGTPLADLGARRYVASVITHLDLGTGPVSLVPPAMPGASVVNSPKPVDLTSKPRPLALTLAWAEQDRGGSRIAAALRRQDKQLRPLGLRLTVRPVPTPAALAEQDADLILLGWSSKVFDAYNELDQFTCGSAFNVARWCDPSYDALMRQAVRTLDDEDRWQIERKLVEKLHDAVPAIPG